jgi:hypothetical protein
MSGEHDFCKNTTFSSLFFGLLMTMAPSRLEEAAPFLLPLTILSPTMVPEEYRYPLAVVVSADECYVGSSVFCLGEAIINE